MLTKKDKEFLRGAFATKDDLKLMEARQDKKYATKDDLIGLAKQKDLVDVKSDLAGVKTDLHDVKTKLNELTDFVVPTLGNILEWTDDIHKAFIGKPSRKRLS